MVTMKLSAATDDIVFATYDQHGFTGCRELIKSHMWFALKKAPAHLLTVEVPTNDGGMSVISIEFHLVKHYTRNEVVARDEENPRIGPKGTGKGLH